MGFFEYRARERRAWVGLYEAERKMRTEARRGNDHAHWLAIKESDERFNELHALFTFGAKARRAKKKRGAM
jgi:hypothetical protein